jgi:hypothetical protein
MLTLTKGRAVVLAVVYAALLTAWFHQISGSAIRDDALGTLIPAVNLAHDGIYSLDSRPPLTPTMYREPVPIALTTLAVAAVDRVLGPGELRDYQSGERARYVKFQNVLWLTLLCTAAFLATSHFTGSFTLSIVTAVLSYLAFLYPAVRNVGVDSLYTEMPAAALLLLASWLLATGIARRGWGRLQLAGGCFGLLALTKAMALPVFAGVLLVFVLYRTVRPAGIRRRTTLAQVAVLMISCAVVVAPWIYRNSVVFQSAQISERSGLSIYMRALFNNVTPVEYRGLFYVWAPSPIRAPVGRALGFTAEDLKPGGALVRLAADDNAPFAKSDLEAQRNGQPEQAVSLIAKARAERVRLRNALRAEDVGFRTNLIADEQMKKRGMEMLIKEPAKTFAGALTSLWRGALLLVPLLGWAVVHAWRRQREDVLMFCVPAIGFVCLLSLFSIFEVRYGGPMTPLALVAATVAAAGFRKYRQPTPIASPEVLAPVPAAEGFPAPVASEGPG